MTARVWDAIEVQQPLPARVARLMLDYLLAGRISAGARLPSERQLAEEIGVGRSVIREALKSLALLGLIEIRQGDGTYLKSTESELLPRAVEWGLLLGERTTADLVEARQHLEVAAAELAAKRRDSADLAALATALQAMENALTDEDFVSADVSFHLAVARASKNGVMSEIVRSIRALLRAWISRVIDAEADTEPSYLEHVPVYEAIMNGHAEAAGSAMRAHLAASAGRLQAALEAGAASAP
jgi:GntR family transcriptional regulator, transcriptional repressor for pyruvate dehydrogenase complex